MRKIFLLRKSCNTTVTSHNFDIMKEAAKRCGVEVIDDATLSICKKQGTKDDVYVATTVDDVPGLYLSGRRKIFYWVQGILPEESMMRHNSRLRSLILSFQEYIALKMSYCPAFVSEAMKQHFVRKYNISFKRYYVFPCFNTDINKDAFLAEGKYVNNYFVYAGGLAVWQCFEQTLAIYKEFEDLGLPNTKLIVLTGDKRTAEAKINSRGIINYEVGFVKKEELPNILSSAKFGFVIRENTAVNRVSTPTKIGTYLSCGLIPIYGSCIESFGALAKEMTYVVSWDDDAPSRNKVELFMKQPIDAKAVFKEFNSVFEKNFNTESHTNNIKNIFDKMLNETN